MCSQAEMNDKKRVVRTLEDKHAKEKKELIHQLKVSKFNLSAKVRTANCLELFVRDSVLRGTKSRWNMMTITCCEKKMNNCSSN